MTETESNLNKPRRDEAPGIIARHRWMLLLAAASAAVLVSGVTAWAESRNSLFSVSNGWTWQTVSWRAQLFAHKAEGDVPDLSWRELWFMLHVHGGFGLESFVKEGFSLEGAVANPFFTNDDHQSGARIFRERCVVCHGSDGTGGLPRG